ncbi:GlxA family transcriptional regulator [Streptomyces sp. NPDC015171]|uniref:GlxA family transcriptional regulator n=1 Tax=Streptomyces sp. NPDC015171 TaxID=3364945 RepID=UPI0036FF367E
MAVLTFPGVQLLDVAGPAEVFTTANTYGARYDVRIVSATGGSVATSAQVLLDASTRSQDLPRRLGTLVVPGRRNWREAVADPALVAGTAELAGRADRVASVCAGAFMLAAAGLLDGRRAATHWRLARELALAYPLVTVESDALFVRDGHVITSAGVTAGIDLALALVEEDHGPDMAREVARELVVFMARPGGQSQFSARLTLRESTHPVVRQVMDFVGTDPSAAHDLTALARMAGVSVRHLSRLFRAHTGMTVGRYAESVRLEAAQALLEAGTEPVDTIAARAGFGSAEAMRRTFQNALGISPTVYRARFRTTAPR